MADDIAQWLEGLGFGQYVQAFAENRIELDIVTRLTEDDLKDIGLPIGDRRRLQAAIEALLADEPPPRSVVPPARVPESQPAEAERRQLTVMFVDLVDSTALSGQLDPEDLREVIRAYQNAVAGEITRFEGHVAKFMGDGVLAYFGWPRAHEDEAERATRAGLAVADTVEALTAPTGQDLSARIGIATGLVIVGDLVGEGAAQEEAVVGKTPNLAARLQGIAEPGQIILSETTQRLLDDLFELSDLGAVSVKGIDEPVQAWRVVREGDIDSRYEAKRVGGGLPLVGRQEELGLLLRSWEASKEGHGQVVLIQGEAGIGKSRLAEALREQLSGEDYIWVAVRFSPYHANSALYPVIEHFKRVMGWTPEDGAEAKLEKLEAALKGQSLPLAEAVPLYAELMSLALPEGRYAPLELSAKQKREQTLDALAGWLLEMAERTPVLQVWEDLHWVDPTTLELLGLYIEQSPTVSMLNVLTYRSEFVPPWTTRSHMTPLTLNRLERPEVEALIGYQANGKTVPSEVIEHIVSKADGVPLYVEELTKSILESDYLHEEADRYTLSGSLSEVAIPATLQDSLMARLDRLPTLREVAQLGAVLGREFAYEMLQYLTPLEEPVLQNGLGQLVENELLYQRGRPPRSRYIFKHALIHDAAYQSLLKRTRQQYHQQVAALMEERFPETVEAHPELVAHHYTEAGEAERAVPYWRGAGERARAQSANLEAIVYLEKGIAMLRELADTETRARQELALQISLGHSNIVAKGHGSAGAEAAYARALALCEQFGDIPELVPVLFSLWRSHTVARPLDEANAVAMRLLRLAEEKRDTEHEVLAKYAFGYTALYMGKLDDARSNLGEAIAQYLPAQRSAKIFGAAQDPGVACRAYLAMAEWLRGFPERAQSSMRESVALAEELGNPFNLAFALCYPGTMVSEMCGGDTSAVVERGIDVATEGGFSLWVSHGKVCRRYIRFKEKRSESALDELRRSVVTRPEIGIHSNVPYYMTLLARAYQQADRIDEALRVLNDAQESVEAKGERWWEAEVRRLTGEFLVSRPAEGTSAGEACLEKALDVARNQKAKSLELRAAMSLARLWRRQGKGDEARRLLGECYTWFTEGFDTADLKEAKVLLDELK